MKKIFIGLLATVSFSAFAFDVETPQLNGAFILASSNSYAVCKALAGGDGSYASSYKHTAEVKFNEDTEVVKVSREFLGYSPILTSKYVKSAKIIEAISCVRTVQP